MAVPMVAAIAFDGISPFHFSVPCLVFGEDRTELGLPRFDFRICAIDSLPIRTDFGLLATATHGLEGLERADIVIVPSWKDLDKPVPVELLQALRRAHARGALIVGLCLGAFAVAAAGLLSRRRATTHWAHAEQFTQLYPEINVEPEVLYVDNGDVITSAGVAAGLDCCLHIMRTRYGGEAALRLARRIVLSPHRQGGQAQFIERPITKNPGDDRFTQALDRVRANLGEPHNLDSVAKSAGLTRRTFTRRFRKIIGTSFSDWLADRRVELAQRLLESSDKSIDVVAFEVGFGSPTSLRQHFAVRLKTSPNSYRQAFSKRPAPNES